MCLYLILLKSSECKVLDMPLLSTVPVTHILSAAGYENVIDKFSVTNTHYYSLSQTFKKRHPTRISEMCCLCYNFEPSLTSDVDGYEYCSECSHGICSHCKKYAVITCGDDMECYNCGY